VIYCAVVHPYLLEHFANAYKNLSQGARWYDRGSNKVPSEHKSSVTTAQTSSLWIRRRDSGNNARHMSESYFITFMIFKEMVSIPGYHVRADAGSINKSVSGWIRCLAKYTSSRVIRVGRISNHTHFCPSHSYFCENENILL
jgi:hypothetical protein